VGGCLREQWYRIQNALSPLDPKLSPSNPEGKAALAGMARLGHIIEAALADLWAANYPKKVVRQFILSNNELFNIDGTMVTAHPDIWIPSLNLDVEVKSVSVGARHRLPIKSHVDQLLLRLYWWRRIKRRTVTGEIPYVFRETFFDPDTKTTPVFRFSPVGGGYVCENTGEVYSLDYLRSLNERLHALAHSVAIIVPPPKGANSPDEFPCRLITPTHSTECPWRENCWAVELAEKRNPGPTVEAAGEIICRLVEAKERQKIADAAANAEKEEVKAIQKEIDPFFDEFGSKISFKNIAATRSEVNVAEKVVPGFSFYRYAVKPINSKK
jgi:hypothetical protein